MSSINIKPATFTGLASALAGDDGGAAPVSVEYDRGYLVGLERFADLQLANRADPRYAEAFSTAFLPVRDQSDDWNAGLAAAVRVAHVFSYLIWVRDGGSGGCLGQDYKPNFDQEAFFRNVASQ